METETTKQVGLKQTNKEEENKEEKNKQTTKDKFNVMETPKHVGQNFNSKTAFTDMIFESNKVNRVGNNTYYVTLVHST